MKKASLGVIFLIAVFALASLPGSAQMSTMMGKDMMMTKSAMDLGMAMRKLWEDHIAYTRNFIISSLAGLEDAGKIAERLSEKPGRYRRRDQTRLRGRGRRQTVRALTDHILIAADVVKAAKAGDAGELDAANKKWYANADDIADFLAGANPNWTRASLADMLHKHLEYTTQEVVSRLKKDWAADILAYDEGHVHMLMFADMLTHGIIKQFPEKFKS